MPLCRAVKIRQEIMRVPEVMKSLAPVEKMILEAGSRTPVGQLSADVLTSNSPSLVKFIARDAGIKQIDNYDMTRFVDVVLKYYNTFSLSDIKLAFELAAIGELDNYLPKDRDGRPDKNHYQTLSVEYITKILNAYRKKRTEVEKKSVDLLPAKEKGITEEEKAQNTLQVRRAVVGSFRNYLETGNVDNAIISDFILYQELDAAGLVKPINITEDDRKRAKAVVPKSKTIADIIDECISGIADADISWEAYRIARRRAIKETYDFIKYQNIKLEVLWKI